jgi:hypothetical protein
MSYHPLCAACCFVSVLTLSLPIHAEAFRWDLILPEKTMDHIDPINLVFVIDKIPQDSMSIEPLTAPTWRTSTLPKPLASKKPSVPLPVTVLADSYPVYEQASVNILQVQYLHTDLLGSVVLETDSTGSVIKSNTYKPFGKQGND